MKTIPLVSAIGNHADGKAALCLRLLADLIAEALAQRIGTTRDDPAALVGREAFGDAFTARRWATLARSGAFGPGARRVGRAWLAPRAAVEAFIAGGRRPAPTAVSPAPANDVLGELGLEPAPRRRAGGAR